MIPQVPFSVKLTVITDEQKKRINPVKSLIDLGARVGLSADYPVMNLDPFRNRYIAITRTDPDDPSNVDTYTANERIDLKTALRCYTVNSAYMVGKENILGSIEVGKKADQIVIDRNLFEIPVKENPEVNLPATMMDGRVVHGEPVDWQSPEDLISGDIIGCHD